MKYFRNIVFSTGFLFFGCLSDTQSLKPKSPVDLSFAQAYDAYSSGNYQKAKQLFLLHVRTDRHAVHYESFMFLAECYKQLGMIDSGRVVLNSGIAYMEGSGMNEEDVADLRNWRSSYPTFPPELREENGFVPYNEAPAPLGGMRALIENVFYPCSPYTSGIRGRIIIQVLINEEGVPIDFVIEKSLHEDCDLMAISAIQNTVFIPGKRKGRARKMWVAIPIDIGTHVQRF
ncbi:MAG: TonB family protein [Fidelibacterota bacterium]